MAMVLKSSLVDNLEDSLSFVTCKGHVLKAALDTGRG